MQWPDKPPQEHLLQQLSHAAVAALLGSFSWGVALGRAADYMLVQVVVPRRLARAQRGSGSALLLKLKSDWHSVVVQVA